VTPESLGVLSHGELVGMVVALEAQNRGLVLKVEALQAEAGKNSGDSSMPPSRDPVAERARQAESRRERR